MSCMHDTFQLEAHHLGFSEANVSLPVVTPPWHTQHSPYTDQTPDQLALGHVEAWPPRISL